MLETLANKEKTSQIAARKFFRTCLLDKNGELFTFLSPSLKNERFWKKKASLKGRFEDLKAPNMVNSEILMVNGANYYVKKIDLVKTYL